MLNQYKVDFDRLVESIEVFPNGFCIVNRRGLGGSGSTHGERKQITELTAKARANMLSVLLRTSIEFNSMITLTYPDVFPRDGRECKKHLNRWLGYMSNAWHNPFAWENYFWFIEFQKRGAPHYHLLVSRSSAFHIPSDNDRAKMALAWIKAIDLDDARPYKQVEAARYEERRQKVYSVHTHTKSWEPIREKDGAIRYAMKYALKIRQKEVPEGYRNIGRFWGCSRGVRANVLPSSQYSIDGDVLRSLLADEGHKASEFDVVPKYLFGSKSAKIISELCGDGDENDKG